MREHRDTLILYTTAVCNLSCRYCYIDKNPALQEIDNILDDSFLGDYYFEMTKELFSVDQLSTLETWGGEPFLRMDRLYHTLDLLMPYYPKLNRFFSSSNLAFDGWCDQFFPLIQKLGSFNRQVIYTLQISIDGPKNITDRNRGEGTFDKINDTFNQMIERIPNELPPNVHLEIMFKPTLDTSSFENLQTENDIIEYYKVFDLMMDRILEPGFSNISAIPALPNFASPCMATKEIGEQFGELVRKAMSLESRIQSHLKHHTRLVPLSRGTVGRIPISLKRGYHTCGAGYSKLGILPFGIISACHNGFLNLISRYKELCTANNNQTTIDPRVFISQPYGSMTMKLEDYPEFERKMLLFNQPDTSAMVATVASQIIALAESGLIDPFYKKFSEATRAAIFYQSHTSWCIRDNIATTGSYTTAHNGLIKLLFNGAHREMERYGEIEWIQLNFN